MRRIGTRKTGRNTVTSGGPVTVTVSETVWSRVFFVAQVEQERLAQAAILLVTTSDW